MRGTGFSRLRSHMCTPRTVSAEEPWFPVGALITACHHCYACLHAQHVSDARLVAWARHAAQVYALTIREKRETESRHAPAGATLLNMESMRDGAGAGRGGGREAAAAGATCVPVNFRHETEKTRQRKERTN
eukprot:357274-Chlamydomonas_euryale.AAC.16